MDVRARDAAERDFVLHVADEVEVNPVLDVQNATAILAAELAASAFGMGIL